MGTALLRWLPVALSALAVVLAAPALWLALRAKALATPTAAMRRLQEKLSGPEGEHLLAELLSQVKAQETRVRELEGLGAQLQNQLRGAVQRVGLERFNSEKGLGGNLSFALVLLDTRNHGICLTSIHSLEACRIFLRGIVNGKTEMPLMPEEETALQQALRS